VVYEALGIPSDFFTANFAMSRSVGWLAHFMESRANNKIIRPAALYVGPAVDTKVA
ncbi:MAG: citrate synthase, partial [Gammaproteobacteria bacterium]|nr:citrate synthase [Gammaproteobacteria bacterium]MBT5686173.1 citrate synthase [Gammaproteobacteria bacterium]MBT6948684.1 citrate synthase [Gammaproteobacteria bacterium]